MAIYMKRCPQGMTAVFPALNSSTVMGHISFLRIASSISLRATWTLRSPFCTEGAVAFFRLMGGGTGGIGAEEGGGVETFI